MRSVPPGLPSRAGRPGAPKGRDGAVEAIRALMVAKRSARSERVQTNGQARALVLTGPDDLRTRFARHTAASLVSGLASLRPRPGDVVGYATRIALAASLRCQASSVAGATAKTSVQRLRGMSRASAANHTRSADS